MKALCLWLVSILVLTTTPAWAQVYEPLHRKAHVSVGPSLTHYFGDLDGTPEQSRGMANSLSVFYHSSARFGLGISITGNRNVAGRGRSETLAIARMSIRSHILRRSASPFIGIGGIVSLGGPETGHGASVAAGYRVGLGRLMAVSPVLRVDLISPDRASDGVVSGGRFDVFANVGIELSIAISRAGRPAPAMVPAEPLPPPPPVIAAVRQRVDTLTAMRPSVTAAIMKVRIDSVYGSRRLVVGEEENYRVRLRADAAWPIQYEWNMGDGVRAVGNNIVHAYEEPGHFMVKVAVRNQYGADSTWIIVDVVPRDALVVSTMPVSGASSGSPADASTGNGVANSEEDAQDPNRYFAWVIESHIERSSAEAAVRKYQGLGLSNLRVYRDTSGSGSDAFRVVVGRYTSTRLAVVDRTVVESKSQRPAWLLTIENQH